MLGIPYGYLLFLLTPPDSKRTRQFSTRNLTHGYESVTKLLVKSFDSVFSLQRKCMRKTTYFGIKSKFRSIIIFFPWRVGYLGSPFFLDDR